MGPKVKKTAKNAYSFFIEDYVKTEYERGRIVSRRVAAEECAPLWAELSSEEKMRYSSIAADHKQLSKADKANKFTNLGISYAELERQQNELKMKKEKVDTEIKKTITALNSDTLKTHLFYIIHCNYYCKTGNGIYVPGELAISEFSLADGIRKTYHTLINPGPIPLGYAFEAKTTIEDVHGLPLPPFEEGESNYFGILDRILTLLEPGKLPDGRYPPLYCLESNIPACENILHALSENKAEADAFFRVFPLHKMFFWLKNKCVEGLDDETVGFPVLANAESEIARDMFCYAPGISCSFHIASDEKYHSCSLSVVQRFVYVICDHCCQHVGVPLIPGKHCRLKANVNRVDRPWTDSKKRDIPALTRKPLPSCLDGQSSYGGDGSNFDWRDGQLCSYLHEELGSKLDDASSISSSTHRSASTDRPSMWSERMRRL